MSINIIKKISILAIFYVYLLLSRSYLIYLQVSISPDFNKIKMRRAIFTSAYTNKSSMHCENHLWNNMVFCFKFNIN